MMCVFLDECNHLGLIVLGQIFFDLLSVRILLFQVGTVLDEPQKEFPVAELGHFKKQRCSKLVCCV